MDNLISPNNCHPVTGLDDEFYLKTATLVAIKNVRSGNGGPFGAVIVTPEGRVFAEGNSVTTTNDPTAHAEVNTIRFACSVLGTFDLSGSVLYSSCEPCPMCLGAALWSRVERVVFAADRYGAADAGFDDAAFYDKLAEGNVAEQLLIEGHKRPFEAWATYTERTEY